MNVTDKSTGEMSTITCPRTAAVTAALTGVSMG
jgi:hypothetical protein